MFDHAMSKHFKAPLQDHRGPKEQCSFDHPQHLTNNYMCWAMYCTYFYRDLGSTETKPRWQPEHPHVCQSRIMISKESIIQTQRLGSPFEAIDQKGVS